MPVLILGAGPAGAACALALARAGVPNVCVAEGRQARAQGLVAVGETIPPDTRALLARLGVWHSFLDEQHEPCLGSCSAWGSDVLGHNDFLLNPQGPGWHLDRRRFDAFLRQCASSAGVRFNDPSVTVENATFVVDATGRSSVYARRCGAYQRVLDKLTFVYGFFDTTHAPSRSKLTLLEAARDGWWYAAALPGERLAVAFAGDADHVRAADLTRDGTWLREALSTRHLAPRLEGCRFLASSLISRVAASFVLDRMAGPRWLAIGDAAMCFDPLAAQGIYKAIADGLEAAACIATALESSSDLDPQFDIRARSRFAEYLANRNYFYGLERRWPGSLFWQRRQARRELAEVS